MLGHEAYIQQIRGEMEKAKMFANHWMAMATTGAAGKRIVHRGDGYQYTPEELIADALQVSLTHIHRYGRLNEILLYLLDGKEVPADLLQP